MTHAVKEKHDYPSDITRKEFEFIRADLEGARKGTKPWPAVRKEITNAINNKTFQNLACLERV